VKFERVCLLRWVFHRGADTLTCVVEAAENRSGYDVCTLPDWDFSAAAVERFDAPASALRRHAEVAMRLREMGWTTHYGHPSHLAA
jgi:hypothetical protein